VADQQVALFTHVADVAALQRTKVYKDILTITPVALLRPVVAVLDTLTKNAQLQHFVTVFA
jgi:hypothetical protein